MVQLSHLYMTAGKTIASTIQTFVGKVMSLVFNTLSRFVIRLLSNKIVSGMGFKAPASVLLSPVWDRRHGSQEGCGAPSWLLFSL